MRFILISLLVFGGLNQILGLRVHIEPAKDPFLWPSHKYFSHCKDDFMIAESSEGKPKVIDSNNEDKQLTNIFSSLLDINVDGVNSPESRKIANSEEKFAESKENVNKDFSLFFADDNNKSDEVKPTEVADLTKSSKKEITNKVIEEYLMAIHAIEEKLKTIREDPNKPIDEDEYTLREKEIKLSEEFFKTYANSIEEDKDNEDNVHTTTKKDSSEEENITTTTAKADSSEKGFLTTHEPDSSGEIYFTTHEPDSNEEDVTTLETNSREEENFTTYKPDSSEEDVITTPKPDSDEHENNDDTNTNDNNKYESFVLHMIDSNEQSKNLNDHKYEIIDTLFSSFNINDENIMEQYVEIRELLDNEENKLEITKIDLDKDFYNIISSTYNEEGGMKKFENDVYVLQEYVDRIKRHINGMKNLNSKLYFQKLIKAAMKDVKVKSTNLMANI